MMLKIHTIRFRSRIFLFAIGGVMSVLGGHVLADTINATDFVTTWKTDNTGISNSTSITIPMSSSGGYLVDWNNDGTYDEGGAGSITHDFGIAGTYTVRIKGDYLGIAFNNGGDRQKILSVEQWGTGQWINMAAGFYGCTNIHIPATDAPIFHPSVTNLNSLFMDASSFNESIDHWNMNGIQIMYNMFQGATSFNQPIGNWNTSSATTMFNMFKGATSFNQPIGNWNTSNVTNMRNMFEGASAFNQNIDTWNVSKVTNFSYMFGGATSFNQPLNSWIPSSGTDFSLMFLGASSFNQNINTWDVSHAIYMNNMFHGAVSFNQPLNNWNVGHVINMDAMFWNNPVFNQPLNNWNTSSVTTMVNMFRNAVDFEQNIGMWNVSNVTNMSMMFEGVTLNTATYDALLTGRNNQMLQMNVPFHAGDSTYCAGEIAKNEILLNDNRTIIDAGRNCSSVSFQTMFVDYDGTVLQTETVQYGSSAVAPANPTRTGYTFSGWNPSDLSNITGDRIFTGQYTINYYTLSFEENGGTLMSDQTGIAYNTTGTNPGITSKTGYIFSGWYMSGSSIPFDFSTPITGNTTLHAQRHIAKYNVTFVDYDGTVLQTGIVQYGSSAVAPASPTRTGYTFSGWNPSDLSNIIGDTIFTGEYTHTIYTLSFDTVGGSSIAPITGYHMSGVIVPNNPTKVGYVFVGWNETVPTTMPLGNKTFIAQRKSEIVPITGYAGGGGGKPITPKPQPEEPKKPVVFDNTDIYNTSISNGYCYKRKSNASIIDSLSITTTQEFKKSLTFLYAYDMTMFRSIDEFDPYRRLTREEAAKIFSNFAMNVLCRKPDKNLKISYRDVSESDPTLKNYITLAYQLGLMKGGSDGEFRPFDTITKAEFNAVLIRMILKSYLPEDTTEKWYTEYNDVSADLGIIKYGATEVPVIRHDATVMLFRAYKEQKFDLRMIGYTTYVLDTRDAYLP